MRLARSVLLDRVMKKTTAMKKLIETGKLTTKLLEPLGISFESFLKLAQRSDSDAIVAKYIEKCKEELPRLLEAERLAKKAEKALRDGDIDAAFDGAIKAANVADGVE